MYLLIDGSHVSIAYVLFVNSAHVSITNVSTHDKLGMLFFASLPLSVSINHVH